MKWLGLVFSLATLAGCSSQVTSVASSGALTSGRASNGGTTSSGGSSSGATGRMASGGTSGGRATTGGHTCTPACDETAVCEDGGCKCLPDAGSCLLEGGGLSCVDEENDDFNCGGCGRICPLGVKCVRGLCACDAGFACPVGSGGALACVDLDTDSSNCGVCGNDCPLIARSCVGSVCQCGFDLTLCGSEDAGTLICAGTMAAPNNCGQCGNVCSESYATGSTCNDGACACDPADHPCPTVPGTVPPTCTCTAQDVACAIPSFARDIYPLLAQETGAFGCSASGCHTGKTPAGGLSFLDENGAMDAGMAYAELLGVDGGAGLEGVPGCDAGVSSGAPSTQCACVTRVVPGDLADSYLIDTLVPAFPRNCSTNLPMPITDSVGWIPLPPCDLQTIAQWTVSGAGP